MSTQRGGGVEGHAKGERHPYRETGCGRGGHGPGNDQARAPSDSRNQVRPVSLSAQEIESNKVAHAMADEYQAWIDCYHGGGDYTEFLRQRLNPTSNEANAMCAGRTYQEKP